MNYNVIMSNEPNELPEFRIAEYANRFIIERKRITEEFKREKWYKSKKYKKTVEWKLVDVNGCIWFFISTPLVSFKTKEEAEKWISDFYKYPIYHYPEINKKD